MVKNGKHQQKTGIGQTVRKTKYKNVITYGTFDLFHIGHLNILLRAAKLGEKLIVGVSTDEFNELKGKKSIQCYEDRKRVIEELRCVDMVIPENNWEQKSRDIALFQAKFVMGGDWIGHFDDLGCIYFPRTRGISSTKLKETL